MITTLYKVVSAEAIAPDATIAVFALPVSVLPITSPPKIVTEPEHNSCSKLNVHDHAL